MQDLPKCLDILRHDFSMLPFSQTFYGYLEFARVGLPTENGCYASWWPKKVKKVILVSIERLGLHSLKRPRSRSALGSAPSAAKFDDCLNTFLDRGMRGECAA